MRRFSFLFPLLLLLALTAGGPALGAVGDPAQQLPDPAQEERARVIGRELRCLVCQNQSIEDSDADLARDLRRIVREQVSAGRSDAQVVDFVHDRYGDFVKAAQAGDVGLHFCCDGRSAVRMARPEDSIIVAGRGHETEQDVNGVNVPLDDRVELRDALAQTHARTKEQK